MKLSTSWPGSGPALFSDSRPQRSRRPLPRRLAFEALEERRLLATFIVTNSNDAQVNTPQSVGTLRQAVFDANFMSDPDLIVFAANVTTVNLTSVDDATAGLSALIVTSPMTIRGHNIGVTIQRSASLAPEMRLFRVTPAGNLTLESLTLSAGVGRGPDGFVGLPDGEDGLGGAIFNQGTLTVTASTFTNNQARGGNAAPGGNGGSGLGGAIFNEGGNATIQNATLSGNSVESGAGGSGSFRFGGGVYSRNGTLSIFNSTITNNTATTGRGVYVLGDGAMAAAEIWSTIIGSADTPLTFDFVALDDAGGTLQISGGNNLIRLMNEFEAIRYSADDPLLAPLGPNGGPTATHALAGNSPAVNHGANPRNLTTDQRGPTFARVSNSIPDIGAFEVQTTGGPALPGDYDGSSVVDAADYIIWRNTLNTAVAQYSGADGDGDEQIGAGDYDVWRANFGKTLVTAATADAGIEPTDTTSVSTVDVRPTPAPIPPPRPFSAAAAIERDAAFVGILDSEPPRQSRASAKIENISPSPWRSALELVLIDVLGTKARHARETAVDLPRPVGEPDDASAARAIDALLAGWSAAIPCGVSF